ncbi:uncharacterized protein TNCV_4471961 [Trichonephila clavipes]|uniref:Transposase n=1 Tax=Trichonephila clavipes TaxID=2585209 RepID=A0A8X6VLX1_TRICX|nr:uncharacterized protein TNCV_4471961 [Trichonephila clavipes]
MDFFWGHIKSSVNETPIPLVEDLISWISVAVWRMRNMPEFQNVPNSMQAGLPSVNGDRYRAMITNFFIPELNNHDVQELWFQQDGATCHTARATIDLLKDTFGDRLISLFGPVNWPSSSCDLTPLDYFLWNYVKSLVYADKPTTAQPFEDNIRRVIADIRPQMLEKVIENWTSRLDYIRASRGNTSSLQAPKGWYQGQPCVERVTNAVFIQGDQPFAPYSRHTIGSSNLCSGHINMSTGLVNNGGMFLCGWTQKPSYAFNSLGKELWIALPTELIDGIIESITHRCMYGESCPILKVPFLYQTDASDLFILYIC